MPKPLTMTKRQCVACGKHKACLLIEIYTPDIDDGYERAGGLTICRSCLGGGDIVTQATVAACLYDSLAPETTQPAAMLGAHVVGEGDPT